MIEVRNLSKAYTRGTARTEVLRGISFDIARGEFVAVMGTSGTGKSTLLNILGGLDKPDDGTYRLDGVDMTKADDDALAGIRNRKIGFVFQQFHLLDRADALQNVMLPLVYSDAVSDGIARAKRALAAVQLTDRTNHYPGELSGGQQQRVAIARALVTDPTVILADEPTGNLDNSSSREILAIFQQLHREGRTLLMITHDPQVAEHADRVIVLGEGRVNEDRAVTLRRLAAPREPMPAA